MKTLYATSDFRRVCDVATKGSSRGRVTKAAYEASLESASESLTDGEDRRYSIVRVNGRYYTRRVY